MSEFIVSVKESNLMFLLASLIATTFTNLVDFYTGCMKALAKGEKLNSGGFRRTTKKVLDYWLLQLVGFTVDCLLVILNFEYPYCTMLFSVSIILIECKSVVENISERRGNAQEVVDVAAKIAEITGIVDKEKIEALKDLLKADNAKKTKKKDK